MYYSNHFPSCYCSFFSLLLIQRGTNAIKKYLASRIEEPVSNGNQAEKSGVKSLQGASGVIGGTGDGVDPFAVATSRTLDYRYM